MTLIYGGLGAIAPQKPATFQRIRLNGSLIFIFKKESFILFIFLKAYVVKFERNYIDIWGSGGDSPQKPATFQRIR